MNLTFSDGTYLITGASSGIGASIARSLARAGAPVVLAARRGAVCEQLARSLREEGWQAEARTLDVQDRDAVWALTRELAARPQGLAGAVNNAATLEQAAAIEDMPAAALAQTFDTNVRGLAWCLQAQLSAMRAAGQGSIVVVASIAAHAALPELAPYGASKAAAVSLARSAAAGAFKDGVRVNVLSPGPTHTSMGHSAFGGEAALDAAMSASPAGRGARPEEVAPAALWLLSEQAGFVTGAELTVDGGFSLA